MTSPEAAGEETLVIDAHQHVGVPGEVEFGDGWIEQDLAARRARLEEMGIARCVVLPAPGAAGGFRNVDHAAMNDSVARYASRGRALVEAAIATVNPAEPVAACREMERAFSELGMAGVAFHHRYLGMQLNDPRMDELLRVASEYDRTVFVHIICDSTFEAPWRVFTLAKRFPTVKFLALDGFSSASQSMMIREWAPAVPNVWFDTGCMTSVAHQLGEFIESCGPERVVLGTDFYSGHNPYFRNAFPLLELRSMGLGTEALRMICSDNIRALLAAQPSAAVDVDG
jgi:uncharacterized protein